MHRLHFLMDKEPEKQQDTAMPLMEDPQMPAGSGHSNSYCAGYKIGYNVEYYWTKLAQD